MKNNAPWINWAIWIDYFAPALILSGWSTLLCHTLVSGQIHYLLAPTFRVYVGVASGAFLGVSVLHLLTFEPASHPAPESELKKVRLVPQLGRLGYWMMLLIPMILAAIAAPRAFSQSTLNNRSFTSSSGASTGLPDSTTGQASRTSNATASDLNLQAAAAADPSSPAPLEVSDISVISDTPAQIRAFVGRKVRVVGVLDVAEGHSILVRWMMWCCAADAQPLSVVLGGDLPGDLHPSTNPDKPAWVEVVGTLQFLDEKGALLSPDQDPSPKGGYRPRVDVESMQRTNEPDEPFLSP